MDTKKIGTLEVSVVGIGCNNFGGRLDQERTTAVVQAALDAGVTFFDTTDSYGQTKSEKFMGNAFGSRRDEAVIATKFGMSLGDDRRGARPEYVKSACEASLSRLQIERIDLYQLHRPDPETPIADTLGALNELIAEGKVREIGCSNFSVDQLREAKAAVGPGEQGFVSVQNAYSLLAHGAERDVLPECSAEGISFLPFFPLFNGMLTGKYTRGADLPEGTRLAAASDERKEAVFNDRNFTIVEELTAFAESRGHTILELALARLIAEPAIASAIAGATSASQIATNARAAEWQLSAEEIAAIDKIAPLD